MVGRWTHTGLEKKGVGKQGFENGEGGTMWNFGMGQEQPDPKIS